MSTLSPSASGLAAEIGLLRFPDDTPFWRADSVRAPLTGTGRPPALALHLHCLGRAAFRVHAARNEDVFAGGDFEIRRTRVPSRAGRLIVKAFDVSRSPGLNSFACFASEYQTFF